MSREMPSIPSRTVIGPVTELHILGGEDPTKAPLTLLNSGSTPVFQIAPKSSGNSILFLTQEVVVESL